MKSDIRSWSVAAVLVAAAFVGCAEASEDGAFDDGAGGGGSPFGGPPPGGAPIGPPPPGCGNGTLEPGEICDGQHLAGASCASATMNARPNGALSCLPNCQFDTSGCAGLGGVGGTTAGTGGFANPGGSPNPGAGGAVFGAGGAVVGAGGAVVGAGGTAVSPGGATGTGPDPTSVSASRAGTCQVATYTSGYRDGPGYADSTIHYPTTCPPPFASVAVVPGFVSPQSSIQPWGPFLASHGIVTMTIGTNTPGDDPTVRSRALLDALETLRTENTRPGGQLNGNLDLSRQAVMGWSMGGGGALITANTTPTLKAAISLCGWSPGGQFTNNTVPSLLFAAVSDPLAGTQSQGFYNSIPAATPKMLFEVNPGNHNIANDPARLGGEIGRYGLSWMKVFLEGDERYRQFLLQRPTTQVKDFMSNL